MTQTEREALELCNAGLQHMWKGEIDSAIDAYDRAAVFAGSEETRELITIRKAEALIAAEREGAEVAALPGIVMRRRTPRHVYLASYALMRRFSEANDHKRALFYGDVASRSANELGDPQARANVLNGLGVILVIESRFRDAIAAFEDALQAISSIADANARLESLRNVVLGNLGGAQVLSGQTREGIRVLEEVFSDLDEDYLVVEACLDLCFGYLEQERYDIAEMYGLRALELAAVKRQIRNANHLLGEICLRTERYDESDAYFDVVAGFYPEFKNVKQLLVAVDLCAVVNWKA
jgi:tetratricopeptide (TPR) repeat protein